ncbi:MAG: nucleotidyltransferase family protein [Pyrinomonadaceae bacterium]
MSQRLNANITGFDALRQVDEFLMNTSPVQQTLRNLVRRLSEEQIDYAVIGGMALALHGFVRPTQDVDLLLTREGLEKFHEELVGRGYVPLFPGARKHFRDTETGVKVEIITTGEYPGDGKPKAIVFPVPEDVAIDAGACRVVRLETLIELKLASGLSAEHRQLRDLADVQQLIETLDLPVELSGRLNESVQDEYLRLWHLAQKAREQDLESGE